MMVDPQLSTIPYDTLARVLDWLAQAPPAGARNGRVDRAASRPRRADAIALQQDGATIRESAFEFSHHGLRMSGVLAEPVSLPAAGICAVLLNAGAVRRIGPNRLYVALARRLAADGAAVVRVDLSGIGDSPARTGVRENLTFHDRLPDDVRTILGWTRRVFAAPIVLAGWCSGGYYAMRAAVDGAELAALALVNPGHPETEPYAKRYQALSEGERYGSSMRSARSWKKLLRGEVDLVHLARMVRRLAVGGAVARAQELARRVGIPLPGDLGSELVQLTKRGVRPIFVYSAGEAVHQLFVERAGATPARLTAAGAMHLHEIAGPDHTFTPRWSHPLLVDLLASAIGAVP